MRIHFQEVSRNAKTGPIPVTTTESSTCPDACPLKRLKICYAMHGPLALHWKAVDNGARGLLWEEFLVKVRRLRRGQLWRHNQAGDLPGEGDTLDLVKLAELVSANKGRDGFTFTHKPLKGDGDVEAVRAANAEGFTVNLSANDLEHADQLLALDCGPVVTVLPLEVQGNVKQFTPKGARVVVCPATYRDEVTCSSCGLCQKKDRKVVVGFPVHGSRRKAWATA